MKYSHNEDIPYVIHHDDMKQELFKLRMTLWGPCRRQWSSGSSPSKWAKLTSPCPPLSSVSLTPLRSSLYLMSLFTNSSLGTTTFIRRGVSVPPLARGDAANCHTFTTRRTTALRKYQASHNWRHLCHSEGCNHGSQQGDKLDEGGNGGN